MNCVKSDVVRAQNKIFAVLTIAFGNVHRGSPIGFSGSGIWLISRPGLGILKEKGDEIRDRNFDRDTGLDDFNRRESGNVALRNRDSGIPETET